MTDIDYPPTRTYVLQTALETAEDELAEARADFESLQERAEDGEGDVADEALREAHREVSIAEDHRDGLHWAVESMGSDAEITLHGTTTHDRASVTHFLANEVMGEVGREHQDNAMVAASVDEAPFFDASADLKGRVQAINQLPPAFRDWIEAQLEELNDLSPGN